jgi:hypothetical protein
MTIDSSTVAGHASNHRRSIPNNRQGRKGGRLTGLSQFMTDVPGGVAAALGVLAGLLLWALGRRVLRPALATAGLVGGAAAGWVVAGLLPFDVPALAVTGVAAVVVALVAWFMYRGFVAATLAVVLGVASPAAVVAWHGISGAGESVVSSDNTDEGAILPSENSPDPDSASYDVEDRLAEAAERLEQQYREARDALRMPVEGEERPEWIDRGEQATRDGARRALAWWKDAPAKLRWTLLATALSGAVLGLLVGLAVPEVASAAITATAGAAVWLGCAALLAANLDYDLMNAGWVPSSAAGRILLWIIVTLIGASIQWTLRPKRADKSA